MTVYQTRAESISDLLSDIEEERERIYHLHNRAEKLGLFSVESEIVVAGGALGLAANEIARIQQEEQ